MEIPGLSWAMLVGEPQKTDPTTPRTLQGEGRAAPHELRVFLPMSFTVGGRSTLGGSDPEGAESEGRRSWSNHH